MCSGLVSKTDFENFKKEQENSMKHEVREEVQRQLEHFIARNTAFMDYIHQRMNDKVKLKAKLDGFPKAWTSDELLAYPALQQTTKNCPQVELFKTKGGESMGKAMLTFTSVRDRQAAVAKSRELRAKVEGQNIYLNNAETELDLKKNKALRQAFGEFKQQWQGEKGEVKIFRKEGQIKIRGVVVAERDESSWQVIWKKPKAELKQAEDFGTMSE